MKRRIALVLTLMSLCVSGIIGLQLYWNYQNYLRTLKTFDHDINAALEVAVNREIRSRHDQMVSKVKVWLKDTTLVTITCNNDNPKKHTVFHLKDKKPLYEDEGVFLGLSSFKESLPQITPAAKELFIAHFADTTVRSDLEKGIVYYYTQRLGNHLDGMYKQTKLNPSNLKFLYREELAKRGITAQFELSRVNADTLAKAFKTEQVNTALRRPFTKKIIFAGFESPDLWFLNEMKWLILTSIILIGITLFCFAFTVKTLLSQQQLVALKENFINNVTHELNTPIASIKITAEALRTFKHDEKTRNSYLEMIAQQTDKLSTLANQVLESANTRSNPVMQVLSLNGLIAEAISDLQPYATRCNAEINFMPAAQHFYISGAKEQFVKVMINLLENAMKYSLTSPKISIVLNAVGRKVELLVADQGIGIPAVYREQIFERFFRVPQGDVHDMKGYGLGLSYVQEVIEQHGGKVSVSANLPRGTIFTIQLPLC